jgi:porphobilinogen synthase
MSTDNYDTKTLLQQTTSKCSLTRCPLEPRKLPFDLPLRMRRNRSSAAMRNLVRENAITPHDLILPIFVEENLEERSAVSAMPGVYRETEKSLIETLKEAEKNNIQSAILFGVSHHKDHTGSDSMKAGGLLDRMVRRAKDTCPDMVIMADICFCEYTDHGHCGPLDEAGHVDNDMTLENLALQSCVAAEAGADIIAPSSMMDGQVAMIRHALDQTGYEAVAILSYAAKFASAFYGPFRSAAGCSLKSGQDRKTYQMDPANRNEAMREVSLDLAEGADMVMVKPGMPYLDIIHSVKDTFKIPVFGYHVSGEYAMLRAAAENGWIDYENVLAETLLSFKRAGADGILTYASLDAARLLTNR